MKGLILILFLSGCGSEGEIVPAEQVRRTLLEVCGLENWHTTVVMWERPPAYGAVGQKVNGIYVPHVDEARVWVDGPHVEQTITHELIHGVLGWKTLRQNPDPIHKLKEFWRPDGCEAKIIAALNGESSEDRNEEQPSSNSLPK